MRAWRRRGFGRVAREIEADFFGKEERNEDIDDRQFVWTYVVCGEDSP
jgi:hypothetical protein